MIFVEMLVASVAFSSTNWKKTSSEFPFTKYLKHSDISVRILRFVDSSAIKAMTGEDLTFVSMSPRSQIATPSSNSVAVL